MLDADLRARGVSKPWVKCWVPRVCPAAARADRQSGPATRRQMIRTPLTQAGRTPWVDSEAGRNEAFGALSTLEALRKALQCAPFFSPAWPRSG